jgi:phosphoribosylanthranilate isomerase
VIPRVKICCISTIAEARLAIAAGASALGLVGQMPSGPGVVADEIIASIIAMVPPPIATFLLTSATDAATIIEQQRTLRPSVLQLVDHLAADVHATLRNALPGIGLVQVVHVEDQASVEYAREAAETVDALLLDSGRVNAPIKELGGTGRVHDWSLSRLIRDSVRVPLFLAGGLHAGNVPDAIRAVEPFGLDVCSGVRAAGALNATRLHAFMGSVVQQRTAS